MIHLSLRNGEWVEVEPQPPPIGTLVLDFSYLERWGELANRASAFAAIPSAMEAAKRKQTDQKRGQVSLLGLLEEAGAVAPVERSAPVRSASTIAAVTYEVSALDIAEQSERIPGLCHHGQRGCVACIGRQAT